MAYNEQVHLFDYEQEFGKRIRPLLKDLGVPERRLGGVPHRVGRESAQPHRWILGWKKGSSKHRFKTHLEFDGFFYNEDDPDRGNTVVQDLGSPRIIYSRTFRPDVDYHVEINESEDSSVESWHEDEFGTSFNVTNRTTSKAEASGGVEGIGEASVSVENETTISLDTSFALNQGNRTSKANTLAIVGSATVPAGRSMLALAQAVKQQYVTDFTVNGYIDHAITIDLYDWVEENSPFLKDSKDQKHNVLRFANLTEFRAFLQGYQVAEYPNMRDFLSKCSNGSRSFFKWLKNSTNRHVQFQRQKIVLAEQATDVSFKFIDED